MRPHVVAWLDGFLPHDVAVLVAPTWFTAVGLAGLVTLLLMVRLARRHGIDPRVVASAVLWGYLAAVLAGIVVPMAIDAVEQYVARGRVQLRWSGMTSFWGYLAGGAAVVAVCRSAGVSVGRLADLAAAPLALALVFARLGCFLAGCDFGKVTALPWAMRFPSGSPAWHAHVGGGLVPSDRAASLPVHPTQLYEAALGLVMVAVVVAVGRTQWAKARSGARFFALAATYCVGRLLVEELRGDRGRGFILGMSSGQVFAVVLLAALAIALAVTTHLGRRLGPKAAALGAVLLVAFAAAPLAAAQPGAQPIPTPRPAPKPAPKPAPAPGPAPVPAPAPEPEPTPAPATEPEPTPAPTTEPEPTPAPTPEPEPTPAPTTEPEPTPEPFAEPLEPYGPDTTTPPPPPPPPSAPPPTTRPAGRPRIEINALFGAATTLNRPSGQVAPLAGPTLSVGFSLAPAIGVWLDLDSMANEDATHGTVLLSGGVHGTVRRGLELGGRVGVGSTLVNFVEPTFRDVAGPTLRAEATVTIDLRTRWFIALRPLSLDVVSSDALGGPIVTWQLRAGVGYRFGPRYRSP